MREEGRAKGANPHAPRNDKPYDEETWLHPTPEAYYTSATKVEPVLKMEPMAPKQNTAMGKI